MTIPRKPAHIGHEGRIVLLAFLAGLPWTAYGGGHSVKSGDFAPRTQWTLTFLIVAAWIGFALAVRQRVVFPLQTLSNLLAAIARRRLLRARPLSAA